MPIFEFKCRRCDERFEELMKRTDPEPSCPSCGSDDIERLISSTSFQLKGTGWHVTDYPSTHARKTGKGKPGERADGSGADEKSGEPTQKDGKSSEAKASDSKGPSDGTAAKGSSSRVAAA